MKKFTLACLILGLLILAPGFTVNAQNFSLRNQTAKAVKNPSILVASDSDNGIGIKPPNVYVSTKSVFDDPTTMMTKYDLQTNSSSGQQRIYFYPDGTIGTVATMSHENGGAYSDRGTGYNYFNGTSWNAQPAGRAETTRTGWPSYQPFGPTGEIILAHQAPPEPIKFCTRPVKGSGSWTESTIPIPAGVTTMWWPRMVTNGPDHTYIHVIAVTLPSGNGGTVYNGMDGALLYTRSLDGGVTWNDWIQLPGNTSSEYLAISADDYAWGEPQGNTLVFVCGDSWTDQFIMKSNDNGVTWTKTIIWPCPYNLWAGVDSVSTYWCPDGTSAVALDSYGHAHVAFGLQRASGDVSGNKYWVPYTDGLVYWNEDMPPFPAVLDPQTLFDDGNYIGWVKDTMVFYPPSGVLLAHYYCSMTSNPAITIDQDNNMFVSWAGVTQLLDPDNYYLRHIYVRSSLIYPDHNVYWEDTLTDMTSDFLQYNWTECMYPDIAANSDDNIYVLFQADDFAGSYVKGLNISGYSGQTSVTENNMIFLKWQKPPDPWSVDKKNLKPSFSVSQNYPNPVENLTNVGLNIKKPGNAILEVTNLVGQKLISIEKANLTPGNYYFVIDGSRLVAGVYFFTVKFNKESITHKMIVE